MLHALPRAPGDGRPRGRCPHVSWALVVWLAACGATPAPSPGVVQEGAQKDHEASAGAPSGHAPSALDEAAARRLLPGTARLEVMEVARERLAPSEHENRFLYRAVAADGTTTGWARPLSGPVTAHESCPCSPLVLTLFFDPALKLVDIVAPAPLNKWNHQPLSAAEHRQMVAIADRPSQRLVELPQPDQLIHIESGATRPAFAGEVVAQAALSTHRLATWAAESRDLIRNTPTNADEQRFSALMAREPELGAQALDSALVGLHAEVTDVRVKSGIIATLAARYRQAAIAGQADSPPIERALLSPGLPPDIATHQVASTCVAFAREGLRMSLVASCRRALAGRKVAPAALAVLEGMEAAAAHDWARALPALREAAAVMGPEVAPMVHLRLAEAARGVGQEALACRTAELIFPGSPLLPGLEDVLRPCRAADGKHQTFVDGLREQARAEVLRQRRPSLGPPAEGLALSDVHGAPRQVSLAVPGHVTVALFFATWCPHCRAELPRINDFARAVAGDPALRGRVQIVGVRTAVAQEYEPFATFIAATQPAFPILTDGQANGAFVAFARQQNLPLNLPTLAVLDGEGRLAFIMPPGDHRDTARELTWAAQSLLGVSP